jgi:uncharacterized protein
VSSRADSFDLAPLRLASGEGRSLPVQIAIEPVELGGEPYAADPPVVAATLDVSRTTHNGYALRLRFEVALRGPCMRCLEPAAPAFAIDVREVDQPGGGDELSSPYVVEEQVDLTAWARDALVLALPTQLLCREDCAGLCPTCGVDLNEAGPEHRHETEPDPRWAKLRELEL